MQPLWRIAALVCSLHVQTVRGEAILSRAALHDAPPVARCDVQFLADTPPTGGALTTDEKRPNSAALSHSAAENPLAYYERTPHGDWPMSATFDRRDPWLRLLLLAPSRPAIVDVAVWIDGKPFRELSEAGIDALLASTQEGGENSSQVHTTSILGARLADYLAAAGPATTREEIRWWMAEWGPGPPVLTLAPSHSWRRADFHLLRACLDADHDQGLSAAEIAAAEEQFRRVDVNVDDVVERHELHQATNHAARDSAAPSHPLVVLLDDAAHRDELANVLRRLYPNLSTEPVLQRDRFADITFRVDLATRPNQPTGVAVLHVNAESEAPIQRAIATSDVVTFDVGVDYVEFSAAQISPTGMPCEPVAQVAIGAAVDGDPLLRWIDRDNNQRLTLRERRQLAGYLAALDRNADGSVSEHETPTPIRLAVSLQPHVHQRLASPAAAAYAGENAAPAIGALGANAPLWFAGMDKNKDLDLSPGEFLGTPEQFQRFDVDGDELLSVFEAQNIRFEK